MKIFINNKPATKADVLKLIMVAYSTMNTQNPVLVKARTQGNNWYYTARYYKEVK